MDWKGRYADGLFVERLWRTVKYEEVYLKAYQQVQETRVGIRSYPGFYGEQRPHRAPQYRTSAEAYQSSGQKVGLSLSGTLQLSS